eukprot:jgi/Mesvir1/17798/Mv12903-RA.1
MSSFVLKFEHGSDMRRRSFAEPVAWSSLLREMETMFPALQGQQILCTYLDEDKDRITISGEGDYEELLRQRLPVVKLTIAAKAPRVSATSSRSGADCGQKGFDMVKKSEKLKAMLEKGNVKRANNFIAKVTRNLAKQPGNPSLAEFLSATVAKLGDAEKNALSEVAKISEADVNLALAAYSLARGAEATPASGGGAFVSQLEAEPRANDVVLRSRLRKAVADGALNGALVLGPDGACTGLLAKDVRPGENLLLTWRLMNTGALPWGPAVVLRQLPTSHPDAPPLGPDTFPVVARAGVACVPPGSHLAISLPLTAPKREGTYEAVYTLQALPKAGAPLWFGPKLRLTLSVRAGPVAVGNGEAGASRQVAPVPSDDVATAAVTSAAVGTEEAPSGGDAPCPPAVICLPYYTQGEEPLPLSADSSAPPSVPSTASLFGGPPREGDAALRARLREAVRSGKLAAACAEGAPTFAEWQAAPEQTLEQTFVLLNTGALPWSPSLLLRRVAGDIGPARVTGLLPPGVACVPPGTHLAVSLPLTTPKREGTYEAIYTLQALPKASAPLQFGPPLRVSVVVSLNGEEAPAADWVEVPQPDGPAASASSEQAPPPAPAARGSDEQPLPSTRPEAPAIPAAGTPAATPPGAPTLGSVESFLRTLVAECQGAVEESVPEGVSGAQLSQRVKSLLLDMYQQSLMQATKQ